MADDDKNPSGHEHRLLNTEAGIADLKTAVASNKLTLEFIEERQADALTRIEDSFNSSFGQIKGTLEEVSQRMESMADVVGAHGVKLAKIDEAAQKAADKKTATKKWMAGVITGAVAVALKEIVVLVLRHV